MNASIWQQLGLLAPPTSEQEVQRAYAERLNAPGSQSLEQLRAAYDEAIVWLREQGEIKPQAPTHQSQLTPQQQLWLQAVAAENERLGDVDELERSLLDDLKTLPWLTQGRYQPRGEHSPVMLKMLARLDRRLSFPIEELIGGHIPEQIKLLRAYPAMNAPLAVSSTSHEQGFGVSSNGKVRSRRRRSRGSYSQREKSVAGWATAAVLGTLILMFAAWGGYLPSVDRTAPAVVAETAEPYEYGSDGKPRTQRKVGDQSALLRSIAELNQVSPSTQAASLGGYPAADSRQRGTTTIQSDGLLFGPVGSQSREPQTR